MSISEPIIETLSSGYRYSWCEGPEQILTMEITRLAEDSRHTIHGELSVDLLNSRDVLSGIRINLMSERSRSSLAKRLAEMHGDIEWSDAVEIICTESLKRYRRGEPVIKIHKIPPRAKPKYRIAPIMFEDEPNVIYGDGDVGKTKLACFMAVLVQDNYGALGLVPYAGNVLYLDWETSQDTIKETIDAIRRGLEIDAPSNGEDIRYRYCTRALSDTIEEIQVIVMEEKISFVIVDSVNKACGGDPSELQYAKAYYDALRSLRVTTLSIDHISKASDGRTPFGSVEKRNAPRSAFWVKHDQEPERYELQIGLYHTKCNIAPKHKPIGLKVAFFMDGELLEKITFEELDVRDIPQLASGLPWKERIKRALEIANEALPVKEIMGLIDATPKDEQTIRTTLNRNPSVFVKIGEAKHAKWGLCSVRL